MSLTFSRTFMTKDRVRWDNGEQLILGDAMQLPSSVGCRVCICQSFIELMSGKRGLWLVLQNLAQTTEINMRCNTLNSKEQTVCRSGRNFDFHHVHDVLAHQHMQESLHTLRLTFDLDGDDVVGSFCASTMQPKEILHRCARHNASVKESNLHFHMRMGPNGVQ